MSDQDEILRIADEMESTAKALLNKAEALRSLRAKQVMQLASPRVVAGPVQFREVLTHESCAIPCGRCDE